MRERRIGRCSGCCRVSALRKDGTVRQHGSYSPMGYWQPECPGVGKPPLPDRRASA